MKTLFSISGYLWAVICLLLIPVTFIGNGTFSNKLARLSFMKVNARFSGGDLDCSLNKNNYTLEIYKPVFTALIGESKEGFVQVKWLVQKELPPTITDTIDFDRNGFPDFWVNINTKNGKTDFKALDKNVLDLSISSKVKNSWLVRVNLKNPKK